VIVAAVVGLGMIALGGSAQLGLWRSWTRSQPASFVLPWWYLGVGVLMALLFGLTADTSAAVALGALGVALVALVFFVGLLVFGVPRFLLPRWYRASRGLS
jgi:hypothetical protein